MVTITGLEKRYPSKILFQDVSLQLDAGKRYGLIGANGAGKSTFLNILSGKDEATGGEVSIKGGCKVGVLGQNQFAFEEMTLVDAVLWGNKRLFDAIKEKEKLYMSEEFTDEINDRLSQLEIICCEEDPTYEYDVQITKILTDLGFDESTHHDLMSTITGGDKFKILLAQVLFPKPDVLFLDEPTNNLDMKSIAWLEEQLKRHEGTMVVISHDRHFLNTVVNHILDVDFRSIREFSGNYDDWYIAATLIQKQHDADRNKKLKEKEELEKFIARFSANASKAKQATSRQKKLDKLDIAEIKVSSRRDPSIMFKQQRAIGNDALDLENISKSYGDLKVFENVNLHFEKGDKVALIGSNGVGKTTLCEIIMERLAPDSGEVKWGTTVHKSYFPQSTTEDIKGDMKLYEWLQAFDPKADLAIIRNCLGRMLFNGEDQEKIVSTISGGEKHRMMLSKIMLEEGNFIVLDEPTNHLDLEAIVALGEAFYNYEGIVICVAHDRELIDAYANRIIEIKEDGTVIDFLGSYEEYLEKQETQA
jgi:ATPase subunit of ABC transporter with duplicated ATPase domains